MELYIILHEQVPQRNLLSTITLTTDSFKPTQPLPVLHRIGWKAYHPTCIGQLPPYTINHPPKWSLKRKVHDLRSQISLLRPIEHFIPRVKHRHKGPEEEKNFSL